MLALFSGVTWLAIPSLTSHAEVTILGSDGELLRDATVIAAIQLAQHLSESVWRSSAGITAPFLAVRHAPGRATLASVNLSGELVSRATRVRSGPVLWAESTHSGVEVSLDPHAHVYVMGTPSAARTWTWLEIGAPSLPALYELPLAGPLLSGTSPTYFSLPLAGRAATPPVNSNGTLVKGSSERLHWVDRGRLRWVTSLAALARLGPPPRIVTLTDAELWRLPAGSPLDSP